MKTKWLASMAAAALASVAGAQETSIPLTRDHWQKTSCGAMSATADGLVIAGTDFRSGNGARSRAVFDFTPGADAFLRFMPVDTRFAAFSAGLEGLPWLLLSTDRSSSGSTVIPKNTWVYLRLRVDPEARTVQQVLSTQDYDTRGGSVLVSRTARLSDAEWAKAAMSQLFVALWDNASGTASRVILGEARTTAAPVTLTLGEALTFDFEDRAIPAPFSVSGAWTAEDGALSLTTSGRQTSLVSLDASGAQLLSFWVKVEINQRGGGWDADFTVALSDANGAPFDAGPGAGASWLTRPTNACWIEQSYVLPPGLGRQHVQWRFFEDDRFSGTPSPIPHRVTVDDVTITCPAGLRPARDAANAVSCAPANQPPTVVAAQSAVRVTEGATATNDLAVADPDGDAVTLTASAGEVVQALDGGWLWTMPAADGPATDEITVTADDGKGGVASARFTVEVTNVAPSVGAIAGGPERPLRVGAAVSLSAAFTDPGVLDTHAATWDLGDGTVVAGTVTEADGSGATGVEHVYEAPGIYTVTCTVTDEDGDSGSAMLAEVVVFDPGAGSVVGFGAIPSPAGAWSGDPAAAGKARFAFEASYPQHGRHEHSSHHGHPAPAHPTGFLEVALHGHRMHFFARHLDWLVVSGDLAWFRGTGWLNGNHGYAFQVTARDGRPDRARIQVWDGTTGEVVYDGQPGTPDVEPPALSWGHVEIIHPHHEGCRHHR